MRFLSVGLLVFLVSCKHSDSLDWNEEFGSPYFKLIENRAFEIDSISSFEFYYFDYGSVDGEEFLYVVNSVNSSVDVYSLEDSTVKKRFPIPREGPGFINKPQGLLFYSPDSIFVFPSMMMSSIILFNHKGELYHHLRVKQKIDKVFDKVVNQASLPSMKTIYDGKSLLFTNLTLGSSAGNLDFFTSYHPNFKVDLENDSLYWMDNITYPESYIGRYWPIDLAFQSNVKNIDKQIVTSWSALDSLIIRDLEGVVLRREIAKSKFATLYDFGNEPLTSEEQNLILAKNVKYVQLLYDEFRGLYYRIATLPREISPGEYLDHTSVYKNDFSVIILNEEFKVLEEVKFPGGIHHPYLAFVGKKGLYISRANPYNPELSEDRISFDVYAVNEN
ncbi:DUF4221 family protein [Algoriphagus sp. D3-2-R+10]|uniref:DUF4221 family protein n=1 Tax=Algoriphagus aurantiacus TaxID=3103948 RepID=UPI002B3A9AC9|nr:DUF4221 family protein [Algoriphagus sp. D3-2-R+10]MEB2778120.1 DUF4221 family protein [Algoriphagus sp. D3-2-R+10]